MPKKIPSTDTQARLPKIVPHPAARDVRRLKALALRARAGLRRDGCVTLAQHQALKALEALPGKGTPDAA
jgi:hypothetical protein